MEAPSAIGIGEFIPLADVLQRTGWAKESLRRRLRKRGIQLFIDPDDERARLIRRADAEQLRMPRPLASAAAS